MSFRRGNVFDLALFGSTTQRVIQLGYVPLWRCDLGSSAKHTREIHPPNGIIDSSFESNVPEVFVRRGGGGTEEDVRIQINSDKNVAVDTRVIQFVRGEVNRFLKKFGSKLTRVEVHLSGVNSRKFGINDKRCLVEARPARHRPLAATNRAQTVRQAVGGALTKLRSGLETFYGRLERRGEDTVTPKRKRPPIGRRRAPVASDSSEVHRVTRSRMKAKRASVAARRRVSQALA